ncbi:MAG: hypothetical protein K5751_13135 [Treponemataceae bacterium]|nr:hypothetical protein [Treponemataceae bacterium]
MSRRGFNPFSGLLSFILLLFIIAAGLIYGGKKLCFDYDGAYATERITYSDEFGITLLVTYHTKYQRSDAKGFACVHIPPEVLIKDKSLWAKRDGSDTSDSEDQLKTYQSVWLPLSAKSAEIPNKGKYFIMEYSDYVGKN